MAAIVVMTAISTRRPIACDVEGRPYRHLAVRVIDLAFRDLASPLGASADQESARIFLAGSPMFYHWCEVADLDPVWMVARARKLLAHSDVTLTGPAPAPAPGAPSPQAVGTAVPGR